MNRRLARKPTNRKPEVVVLPVVNIMPDPSQPRKTFGHEELSSLADSLLETGQISPIVVRPGTEGKYTIVVGERRWRAAMQAGLSHVECIIRDDVDEPKAREMQLAENYHREDIPPLEQARALKDYLDRYKVSQSELSRRTGVPQRSISNRLALLSLPSSLQARLEAHEMGPYEALKIAALPANQQEAAAEALSTGRMGGRELEKLARHGKDGGMEPHEASQPDGTAERAGTPSQRLENLEKAVYELAATYAFNEIAREMEAGGRRAPPCPECAKQGNSGVIRGIKRKETPKDRRELIECWEGNGLSEEEIEDLLEQGPTHIIEARRHQCGYEEFISYAEE